MYDKPLTNLDNTLYYDENGLITQRVGISGGSVSITGPVTIPGTITVNSTPASPVHVHLTEMGAVDLTTATALPISRTTAPDSNRITVKLDASMASFPNAIRHSTELAANAINDKSCPNSITTIHNS